jgi:carboxyl-terminal processing protease
MTIMAPNRGLHWMVDRCRHLLSRQVAIGITCLVLSVSALVGGSASSTPSATTRTDANAISTVTREGRLAVFDDLWETVYQRYYDPQFHGIDWSAQRANWRIEAANANGPRELYAVLRRLLGLLEDAHTRVYAPEEKFEWQHPRFLTIGFSLREVQGQPTVFSVEPRSEAERVGIRAGDVIETIDGVPAITRLEQKLREQSGASTPQAARLFAMASLTDGVPNTTVAIAWKDADNQRHQTVLHRKWRERSFALQVSSHRGIAVVAIDAFTSTLVIEFEQALNKKFRKARGVVVDLRNNGGGDAGAMAEIASAFLPPAIGLGQFTDRHGYVALKLETATLLLSARHIEAPIVILVSDRTSSAAEIFTAALQQTGRATVLGSETCGCVLAVRNRHSLPDGGELEVSELDYQTTRGARLEGHGIEPNEVISLKRQDIYSGRDRILELALTRLR